MRRHELTAGHLLLPLRAVSRLVGCQPLPHLDAFIQNFLAHRNQDARTSTSLCLLVPALRCVHGVRPASCRCALKEGNKSKSCPSLPPLLPNLWEVQLGIIIATRKQRSDDELAKALVLSCARCYLHLLLLLLPLTCTLPSVCAAMSRAACRVHAQEEVNCQQGTYRKLKGFSGQRVFMRLFIVVLRFPRPPPVCPDAFKAHLQPFEMERILVSFPHRHNQLVQQSRAKNLPQCWESAGHDVVYVVEVVDLHKSCEHVSMLPPSCRPALE
eukprot:766808-Hanusia_phi.AAC.5